MPSNKCRNPRCKNCIMFSQGFCTALKDTDFGEKRCPFFKSRKGRKEEHEQSFMEGPPITVNRYTKLPRFNLRLESIMHSADQKQDLYTVDSENAEFKFIADKNDILIMSHKNGYIRVPLEDVEELAHEVAEVAEVVRVWRRGRS